MRLQVREFESKGKKYTNYLVKKLDAEGNGLIANTVFSVVLAFDVRVQRTPYTDKKTGVQKTIINVIATGKANCDIENVTYNEYGSATFVLPEKLETTFATARKGDTVFMALKTFEAVDKDTNKPVKRMVWVGSVNQQLDLNSRAGGSKFPVQAKPIVSTASPNEWADDVKNVIKFCLSDKESFKESFYVDNQKVKPQAFIDWMKSNEEVTSKLDDGQLITLYWEIVEMIK
jgi:hypothetical protein